VPTDRPTLLMERLPSVSYRIAAAGPADNSYCVRAIGLDCEMPLFFVSERAAIRSNLDLSLFCTLKGRCLVGGQLVIRLS